jgi:hypothetical protein
MAESSQTMDQLHQDDQGSPELSQSQQMFDTLANNGRQPQSPKLQPLKFTSSYPFNS